MFDKTKYQTTDEYESIDDLREWMKYNGHLWFFIDDKYYFMTGSHNFNKDGVSVPWWYITRGDYEDATVEQMREILWEFWDIEDVWVAKIFNGKSFAENFNEFIFFY